MLIATHRSGDTLLLPEETLFSLVAAAVRQLVRDADRRNELLVPDWRDTIMTVYGSLTLDHELPDHREALMRVIDEAVSKQVAGEQAGFLERYEAERRAAPSPPDDVVALVVGGEFRAAIDLYRRYAKVGTLIARDTLAAFAEEKAIAVPARWHERKAFPSSLGNADLH